MHQENRASFNGKRDLTAILYPSRDKEEDKENDFESMTSNSKVNMKAQGKLIQESINPSSTRNTSNVNKPHPFYFITAILCGVVLCLPIEGKDSSLPSYFHLSTTPKIIAAYMLSLIHI